jgi:RNA 2',3'-cyclic 3'-phosphodiesterase
MNQLPEIVRSFIAIELPEDVKLALKNVEGVLSRNDPGIAKWVDPNAVHLTLKFLGGVPNKKLDAIISVVQDAVRGVSPFDLTIQALGAFPNLRRVRVVWVGLAGDLEVLQKLQDKIETNLVPLGFPVENRSFTPHLTLARLREDASPLQRQTLGEIIARTTFESPPPIKVDAVNLMRSELTRAGAIYTCLNAIELKS